MKFTKNRYTGKQDICACAIGIQKLKIIPIKFRGEKVEIGKNARVIEKKSLCYEYASQDSCEM